MKQNRKYNLLGILTISMVLLACSFIPTTSTDEKKENTTPSIKENTPGVQETTVKKPAALKTDFPMPPDAKIISSQKETATAQVKMSIDDLVAFYRKAWVTEKGLKENKTLTVINKTSFSLVFSGSENGKSIVLQGADLGDGSIAFSIRYEDV